MESKDDAYVNEINLESLTCPVLIPASTLREMVAEVERLRAIVDKLPKYADGLPMLPGDEAWFVGTIEYENGARVNTASGGCRITIDMAVISGGVHQGTFWSSREAMKAAIAGGKDAT